MTLPLSRRGMIITTTGLVVAPAVAGCGTDEGAGVSSSTSVQEGTPLLSTSEVPVGGYAINADAKVVVSQPTEGEFRAFSAVCTHQGCLVSQSSDAEIPCKCHGSRFALADGAVLGGPATEALAPVEVTVVDGMVTSV